MYNHILILFKNMVIHIYVYLKLYWIYIFIFNFYIFFLFINKFKKVIYLYFTLFRTFSEPFLIYEFPLGVYFYCNCSYNYRRKERIGVAPKLLPLMHEVNSLLLLERSSIAFAIELLPFGNKCTNLLSALIENKNLKIKQCLFTVFLFLFLYFCLLFPQFSKREGGNKSKSCFSFPPT